MVKTSLLSLLEILLTKLKWLFIEISNKIQQNSTDFSENLMLTLKFLLVTRVLWKTQCECAIQAINKID